MSPDHTAKVLKEVNYNWFELVNAEPSALEKQYNHLCCDLTEQDRRLLTQSHAAYLHIEETETLYQTHNASLLNGDIVSELIRIIT